MLTSLLWLAPSTCEDTLSTISKILGKEVPLPGPDAGYKLRTAAPEQLTGVLQDDELREHFAQVLDGIVEVTSSSGTALVEKLGLTLAKRVGTIKAEAKAMDLKGGPSTYAALLTKLPKGTSTGDALRNDWLLWHVVGNQLDPTQLPLPLAAIVMDRLKLAIAAVSGPIAGLALNLHVLENMEAYVKWEASIPGSKSSKDGLEVLQAFDSAVAMEVAVRRMLCAGGLPPAMAAAVAAKAPSGTGLNQIIKEMSAAAKTLAVLPAYVAPPPPKEPKDPNQKKDKEGGKKDKGGDKGSAKEAASAPKAEAPPKEKRGATPSSGGSGNATSAFGSLHASTVSQELKWQLLQYQMRPRTTLGEAALCPQTKSVAASAAAAKKGPVGGVGAASRASPAPSSEAPRGFAGCWAPVGGDLPPGHTQYSWNHALAAGMQETGFANTWEPVNGAQPPGHTPYSWEKALSAGGAPSSSTAAPPPAAKPVAAPKQEAKAKQEAKPKQEPKAKKEAKPKAEEKKQEAAPTPEDLEKMKKDKLKKVIKEGGKRGVEIEGAADMGGLQFFCTSVALPDGDLDLLLESMKAMNTKNDPTEEERKGGSGHIGKMIFSAGTEQLAVVAYVPAEKQKELSCAEWLQVVLQSQNGEVKSEGKDTSSGVVKTNADKGIFPLKIREAMILEANNFLRKKGLFPEDDSDDDEMVFGDDDFPSM